MHNQTAAVNEQLLQNNLEDSFRRKPWWLRLGLGVCVWTLLGLSFALSTYLGALQDGVHIAWSRIASGYLADFYLWGMLSPLIFMMARRYELRARFPRNLLIHVGLSIALSFVVLSAASPLVWYFGYVNLARNPTLAVLWRNNAFSIYYFHQGLTIYWTTLVVAHALQYYRGQRESEKRTAQLAAQLAQAQLQALKMQIHPHFLFNTLNSIAALLHQDVEVADRMIARLGDFLRLTLSRSDAETTNFAQELEFLTCYLEIERTRFADRLIVEMEVEPQTLGVIVPNLILQPIVENAIRHGVARQTTGGHITIRACKKGDRFIVQIEDNGPGLGTNSNGTNSGIGLSNTRARLEQHYPNNHRFEIVNLPTRGVVVTLEIPAVETAESEA
jgi:two-component system LytT family sensor kinase